MAKSERRSPTVRLRRLMAELRRLREDTGLSREEVAARLEWSTSTVFRIETGRSRPQPRSVRELLELYGVAGTEKDALVQLAREARQPGWWHSFKDVLPDPYAAYIGLEAEAATIRNYEPLVVPGQLQTPEYTRAVLRGGPLELGPDEVDRRAEVRVARQELMAKPDRPRLWAVVDEVALRRAVGGRGVMRAQLRQLAEAALGQGTTTIQVIPFAAGAHAGTTGPFVILSFRDPALNDVVYVETIAGDIYVEEPADVERFSIAFDRLLASALSPDDSVALIERAADEYR